MIAAAGATVTATLTAMCPARPAMQRVDPVKDGYVSSMLPTEAGLPLTLKGANHPILIVYETQVMAHRQPCYWRTSSAERLQ